MTKKGFEFFHQLQEKSKGVYVSIPQAETILVDLCELGLWKIHPNVKTPIKTFMQDVITAVFITSGVISKLRRYILFLGGNHRHQVSDKVQQG